MPLVPSFTLAPTSNLGQILVTDTSTGSDGAITDRVITARNAANAVIGTFDFPLSAGSSILISAFTADTAANWTTNWNKGSPFRRSRRALPACAAQGQYVPQLSTVSAAGLHAEELVPGGSVAADRKLTTQKAKSPAGFLQRGFF